MTLVPVSKWLADKLSKSFLQYYPIKVIHNGIDINLFSPSKVVKSKYGIDNKFVVLGVANIWVQRKGLDDFIKLSSLLQKDEIIMLVGLSAQQIKRLPNNIIGIQRTKSISELAELYSLADVFF